MEAIAEETVEEIAEVAEETPEIPKGFIPVDKHQKDINVQHKKYREEERARKALAEENERIANELAELKAKQSEVIVPPVPDPYSETYQEDIQKRDEAIKAQADHDAAQARKAAELKKQDEARQATADAALNERVATFNSNMVSHGLNEAEVKSAAENVIDFGISETFQDILLDDKDGPLFVKYLDANPVEAERINSMSTMDMVAHLNAEVRPKALLLKPQTSAAPNPPITLDGGGAPETRESWEQGVKYE